MANCDVSPAAHRAKLEVDLRTDWLTLKRDELARLGFQLRTPERDWHFFIEYFNVRIRMVAAQPRRVIQSREFLCAPELAAGLERLLNKARNGDDLNPHQSTRIRHPHYNDALLNDWGIHHFHLGLGQHDRLPFFVDRTNEVLFARVTPDALYCVAILPHRDQHGDPTWACQQLVDIIHRNWPATIAEHRWNRGDPGRGLTDGEVRTLRSKGAMHLTHVADGTVYHALGGGYASAGNGLRATLHAQQHLHTLQDIESRLRERVDALHDLLVADGFTPQWPLRLRLREDAQGYMLVCPDCPGAVISLGRPFV